MYVIGKVKGEEFYFLSEVDFGSNLSPEMPEVLVHTQWTWADPSSLDYPYNADLMYFENRSDAYALLVAMDLMGEEIITYQIICVEG